MREARDARRDHPLRSTVLLALGDVSVQVRTNLPAIAERLERYFAAWRDVRPTARLFRVDALHGEPRVDTSELIPVARARGRAPKEAYRDVAGGRIVHKVRTGVVFFIETNDVTVIGDLETNFNQLVNLVANLYAQAHLDAGYAMVHASAATGDAGVAFVAGSGGGKSTLALALLEREYRFVTNDRLLLRVGTDGVEMIGVPKQPRVNPGTMLRSPILRRGLPDPDAYRGLDREALWRLEEKHDVDVVETFGAAPVPRAMLETVYVLSWKLDAGPMALRALAPDELAERLWSELRTCGVFDARPRSREGWRSTLESSARGLRGFEVGGGVDVDGLADHATAERAPI